jgi:2-amino-4-hydroxy-6-hydroxymethyldihydropteridine diphosphokinase
MDGSRPVRPIRVALSLGSNLGDRARFLNEAISGLADSLGSLSVSTFYETDPVGVSSQERFLNAAVAGTTTLAPRDLLLELLRLEGRLGRERPYPGAPRTIDLDLVLYGSFVIDALDLVVPHPRFRERRFVLAPLAEIAPDWIDPVTGRSVAALLRELDERGGSAGAVESA